MTFTVAVEHEVIGDDPTYEEFEGVEAFDDPPMTDVAYLRFADEDRDDERLAGGNIVSAKSE